MAKKPMAKKPFTLPAEHTWTIVYRDAPTGPVTHTAHAVSGFGEMIEFSRKLTEKEYVTTLILPRELILRVELVS